MRLVAVLPVTKRNAHVFLGYILRTDNSTYVCELIAVFMQARTNHHIPVDVHIRKFLKSFLPCCLTPKTIAPVTDVLVMTTLTEF